MKIIVKQLIKKTQVMKKIITLLWIVALIAFASACFITGFDYISDGKMTELSILRWITYPTLGVLSFLILRRFIRKTLKKIEDQETKSTLPLWKLVLFVAILVGCNWLCIYLGEHIWCLRDAAIYLETFLICFSGIFILTKHN